MKIGVFDIECDGFNPTKIHCLSAAIFSQGDWRIKSTTSYDEMIKFFNSCDVVVGHNIIRFDIPVVERILGIKVECELVDTLAISWYLYPFKLKHGLEEWGVEFGVPKPKIDDWDNLSVEEYTHRCIEDVKINCKLWDKQFRDLDNLYETEDKLWRFIKYLTFKMDCARAAEESRWKLDVERCEDSLIELEGLKEIKIEELRRALPKTVLTTKMNYPARPYKKDGSLSSTGQRWFTLLKEKGLQETRRESVEYIRGYEQPNPNSTSQIKKWLFDMGWIPETFSYVVKKDEKGKKYTDKIPQIRVEKKGEKLLCPSVKKLIEIEPAIEALDGLTVLSHRIGILKGYLKNVDDEGYLQARISGLTNTLRFKHSVVVNLPAASKPYGDIVRGVLIAPEGYELCGSDMSSLEDRTKQHYMWDHDPDYVKEMQTDDFDPHLALAEFAGALTPEQVKSHKTKAKIKSEWSKAKEGGTLVDEGYYQKLYDAETDYSMTRHLYKTANYSCTYGAGGKKLALTLKISEKEGHEIVKAYRDKNWAIEAISKEVKSKKCLGQLWLYNPVNGFWYSLRHEKDKFSTLNQGTGVYCFDIWICNFRKKRPQITGQMHDEVILCIRKGNRDKCEKLLRDAIHKTNRQLRLNRELDIDVQFGTNYAEIH